MSRKNNTVPALMLPQGISEVEEGGIRNLARNRMKSRERKRREEMISPRNEYGFKDPTPYQAVIRIRKEQSLNEVKKMEQLTISVEEMAKQLGISKPTAYTLTNSAGFPILKIGKRKVVPIQGLQEWIKKSSGTDAQHG